MRKVKIIDINGFDYTLEYKNKKYIKNINFYDVKLNIGDYIYISDKVLNETNLFTYGLINDNTKEEDVIKVVSGNKQLYLKRYYG